MPHVLAGKPKLRALLNRQAKLAYPAQGDLPAPWLAGVGASPDGPRAKMRSR